MLRCVVGKVDTVVLKNLQGQVVEDKLDTKLTVRIRHELCCSLADKPLINEQQRALFRLLRGQ